MVTRISIIYGNNMKSPLEDTIWGALFGSVAAVERAFDGSSYEYHDAILETEVPWRTGEIMMRFIDGASAGIDFGCGSGVLGVGLRHAGFTGPLDGLDVSARMLEIAVQMDCYRELTKVNLLREANWPHGKNYDFGVSVGLVGDYLPYYFGLPQILSCLKPDAYLGFAVEQRSTSQYRLEQKISELGLKIHEQTSLEVPPDKLEGQTYEFYVVRRYGNHENF